MGFLGREAPGAFVRVTGDLNAPNTDKPLSDAIAISLSIMQEPDPPVYMVSLLITGYIVRTTDNTIALPLKLEPKVESTAGAVRAREPVSSMFAGEPGLRRPLHTITAGDVRFGFGLSASSTKESPLRKGVRFMEQGLRQIGKIVGTNCLRV